MRPLRLELAGFGSFRDPTTVELDDADLFVLSGPTGAGKSTIIDAVVFALYGKVPRLADDRAVEPVISRGLSEARVRCTFRSRGEVHTATRVVRRTRGGGASTKEARLETEDGRVLAGNVRELDEQVVQLLGLEFEHFTRCVVLPQGAFQAFLHARGAERQKLLSSLLNLGIYGQLQQRAGEEGSAAKARLTAAESQLEGRLATASEDAVAHAEQRATALAGLRTRLEDAQPTYDELLAAGRAAAERERTATARHEALLALERPLDVDATSAELADLDAKLETATTARDTAANTLEQARAAAEAHPSPDALAAQVDRVRRLGVARGAIRTATADLSRASDAVSVRRGEVVDRETATQAAATAVEAARDRARAATLATGLGPGDECPVCLRELDDAPAHLHGTTVDARDEPAAAIRAAQAEAAAADERLAASRVALGAAERAEASTRAQLASAEATAGTLEVGAAGSDLPDDLDRLGPIVAEARRLAVARDTAATVLDQAATALRTAESAMSAADARRRAAAADLAAARDGVAALGWGASGGPGPGLEPSSGAGTEQPVGPPPIDPDATVADGWDALLAWRDDALADVDVQMTAARQRAGAARQDYAALLAEHRAAARGLDVDVSDGGGQSPLVAVAAAAARADGDVVRRKEELAERDRVRAEAKEAGQEQQLLRTLAQRLDRRNFQQWLLNRALARVVAGATDILHDLSGGAYRLAVTDDGSFAVIDRANADERRSVRTLSGGETFLASLALALALSDHVVEMAADGAAPLETLFIDEGFGTLDAETLQVVAAALHELSASGRAVGIVTHVAELARLVPTRFEVRKVGNASTVTRTEVEA